MARVSFYLFMELKYDGLHIWQFGKINKLVENEYQNVLPAIPAVGKTNKTS
jgi:hypothetical protein